MKPKLIITLVILIFLVLILGILFTRFKQGGGIFPGQVPVSSSSPQSSVDINAPLSVVSTDPQNGAAGVSPSRTVIISYNKPLTGNLASIRITPPTEFTYQIAGKDLIVHTASDFQVSTEYRFDVLVAQQSISYALHFTTTSQAPEQQTDTTPELFQKEQNSILASHPDSFLFNNLPHSETNFSAYVGLLKTESNPNYSFIIVAKNPDQEIVTRDALSWAHSLGLTDQQIASFSITYLTSTQFDLANSLKTDPPYNGHNFTFDYTKSTDTLTVIIYPETKQAGEQEFSDYLKRKGIESKNWINRLEIHYQ